MLVSLFFEREFVMKKIFTIWTMPLAVALAMSVVSTSNQAMAAAVVHFTPPSVINARNDGPFTIGNLFTVGANDIVIDALGAQDYATGGATGDGFLAGSVEVGLWDATGAILHASATVVSADTLEDTYRYSDLNESPTFTLEANTTYLIGAYVGFGIERFEDGGQGAPDEEPFSGNGITLNDSRFDVGGALAAPLNSDPGGFGPGRWGPANARVATVIPEPSSLMLVGLGAIGLIGRRRRK